ncbi:hypothetical protein FACS1894201_01150 [Bacteroidia bacterium]|nr:hypothetical protein FACS1894201_01150 [Bacteroidia bacterium]
MKRILIPIITLAALFAFSGALFAQHRGTSPSFQFEQAKQGKAVVAESTVQDIVVTSVTGAGSLREAIANAQDGDVIVDADSLSGRNIEFIVTSVADSGAGTFREALTSLLAGDTALIRFADSLTGKTIFVKDYIGEIPENVSVVTIEGNGVTLSGGGTLNIAFLIGDDILPSSAEININRMHFTGFQTVLQMVAGHARFTSCIFSNNPNASPNVYAGGAIYQFAGRLEVIGCTFYGNEGGISGGAIGVQNGYGAELILMGNVFYENTASGNGGTIGAVRKTSGDTVISGGYNVYDAPSKYGTTSEAFDPFTAAKDTFVTVPLISTVSYKPLYNGIVNGLITTLPANYPTVDFYGDTIVAPAAAGAVQTPTADGYHLTYTAKGPGTVLVTSGSIDEDGLTTNGNITFQATVDTGASNVFGYWTVNGDRQLEPSTTLNVAMNEKKNVEAIFHRKVLVTNTIDSKTENVAGSLRSAVTNLQDYDWIQFADSLSGQTIVLDSALPNITKNLIIEGNGIVLSGNNQYRLFYILTNVNANISNVHFTNGNIVNSVGGAILCSGHLNLQSCIFSNNTSASNGGAIYSQMGSLVVSGSTFYNNGATNAGAIYVNGYRKTTLLGNVFFDNTPNNVYKSTSTVVPPVYSAYNVYNGTDGGTNYPLGVGDSVVTVNPLNTITFVPTVAGRVVLNRVPSHLANFPATDFNGVVRGAPTTLAGALLPASYTVTFVPQNGNTNTVVKVEANTLLTEPANLFLRGYHIEGWYEYPDATASTAKWNFAANEVIRDTTLYAYWVLDTFYIVYNLNGGTNHAENPAAYTVLDSVVLQAPTKSDYTFAGWYDNAWLTGDAVNKIVNSTVNRTFYADWTFGVNAAMPTITTQPASDTVEFGTALTLTVVATTSDSGTLSYQWYSNTSATNVGGQAVGNNSNTYNTPNTLAIGTYYYYVVVTNTNNSVNGVKTASDTSAVVIVTVIAAPSAIVEAKNLPLRVYPNPVVNGELRIENGELRVEIYNVNGGLVAVHNVSDNADGVSITINIAHLPAGEYIVKVRNRVAKVVKK